MILRSVYDAYELSSVVQNGFGNLVYPLQFAAQLDDDTSPAVILSYDCRGKRRIDDLGLVRPETTCAHLTLWLLKGRGQEPVCVSFGAACLLERFEDGEFKRVYAHLQKQAQRVFAPLEKLPNWRIALNSRLMEEVEGVVMPWEQHRIFDACKTYKGLSQEQVEAVLEFIELCKFMKPNYSLWQKNCRNFGYGAIRHAGIPEPPCSDDLMSYPEREMRMLERECQGELVMRKGWGLQPSAVTRRMMTAHLRQPHIMGASAA